MMETTVVGSFPSSINKKELAESYYSGEDPYLKEIEFCVNAQIEAGIEIISDGQIRDDMVKAFTRKFRGVRVLNNRNIVKKEIEFKKPILYNHLKYAKEVIDKSDKKVKLKGIVTGPFTLSRSSINEYYDGEEEMAFDYAKALNKEIKSFISVVDYVQVDEPFLSIETPDYAKELINITLDGVEKPKVMHVCGDINGAFSKLIEYNVDVLDNEFALHPSNLDVIKEYDFKQKMGFGCLRSDYEKVETVDEIVNNLRKGIEIIGPENIMVDPDCGLKNLSVDIAIQKLKNMREARDIVRGELL